MKTKYIKGTRKKYSIREDGKIFSNYKRNKKGVRYPSTKEVKSVLVVDKNEVKYMSVSLYVSKSKRTTFRLKQLMSSHFELENRKRGSTEIICIDGDPTNCSIENLKHKNKWNNKRANESTKAYRSKYPDRAKESQKKSDAKSMLHIDKRYVRNFFLINGKRMPSDTIPDSIVCVKRTQLKLHRELKK